MEPINMALKGKPVSAPPKPSLSDQWSKHLQQRAPDAFAPIDLGLPSGMTVKVQRTSILVLMQRGLIPDAIAPLVESMIKSATDGGEDAVRVSLNTGFRDNPAAFNTQFKNLLNAVWIATVVEPRFTDAAVFDGGAFPVDAVDDDDKSFVFSFVNGVTESVAAFRERRTRESQVVGTPPDGDDVQRGPFAPTGD